jgi:hypothetical protein
MEAAVKIKPRPVTYIGTNSYESDPEPSAEEPAELAG